MAVDPVCHKEISKEKSAGQAEHRGQSYYFCSKSCEKSFRSNPEHFTRRGSRGGLHKKTGLNHSASCDFTAL